MEVASEPKEGIVAIYSGMAVVVLALLSSAQEYARYADVFTLAPGILTLHAVVVVGWVAVAWAMATGRSTASAEEVFVLASFTVGAVVEMEKQMRLCLGGFNADLVAAVVWAQLLVANDEAVAYGRRLAGASAKELTDELRLINARLGSGPLVSLPSGWFRSRRHTRLLFERLKADAMTASRAAAPDELGARTPRTIHPKISRDADHALQTSTSSFRILVKLVNLYMVQGYRDLTSLPLHVLFYLSKGLQVRYASWVLKSHVRGDLARSLARRWLRISLREPPESFPHCNAWELWALSTAVDEEAARDLTRAMTCPSGQSPGTWTDADARQALHRVCGWGATDACPAQDPRTGRRNFRWWGSRSAVPRVVPSARKMFLTFVLAAINIVPDSQDDGNATTGTQPPTPAAAPPCTLDDATNRNKTALAALYQTQSQAVADRGARMVAEIQMQHEEPPREGDEEDLTRAPPSGVEPAAPSPLPPPTADGSVGVVATRAAAAAADATRAAETASDAARVAAQAAAAADAAAAAAAAQAAAAAGAAAEAAAAVTGNRAHAKGAPLP